MRFVLGLALTLLLITTCGCNKSELDSIHTNWKKLPVPPATGAIVLEQAKTSPCTWYVQEKGNRVTIQRVSVLTINLPRESRVQFAGGTLVGEDRGEFGGSLSVSATSNQTTRQILSKNVLQMFPMRDGVTVITGDLASNQGSVWSYSSEGDNGWSIHKKADLHGYPRIIGKSGDRLLFAYGDAVSTMEDFNELQIAPLPLLDVHPNSIARDAKGYIYVGMNAFVVRLVPDPHGYSPQWFTQGDCLR